MKKLVKSYLFILFAIAQVSFAQSPISSGFWVKMAFNNEGVFRISSADLQNAGFNLATLDPRNIQLRGHQGAMLPEYNANRIIGLPEIPIYIEGETDGKFDASDFIIFYAGGPNKWRVGNTQLSYNHIVNAYNNTAYLYLGVGSKAGLRIQTKPINTSSADRVITKSDFLFYHDSDIVNPIAMGRTWLGEKLGNETLKRSFTFNLPTDCSDSVYLKLQYGAFMADASGSMLIKINGINQVVTLPVCNPDFEGFRKGSISGWYKIPNKQINLVLELTRPNTSSSAWLDYVELITDRNIPSTGMPYIIRNSELKKSGISEVQFYKSGLWLWDVSQENTPVNYTTNATGSVDYVRIEQIVGTPALALFNPAQCSAPKFVGLVQNQNILAGEAVNLILICPNEFSKAAEQLAAFRRSHDGYKVKIVSPQSIYNEYNASMQDIVAIRDYLRDEYQKSKLAGTELKYVTLIGATSYDFKDRVQHNTNYIPIYEDYSDNKGSNFCLDDFYTYFDSTEGRPYVDNNDMDIAIGRLPVRSADEAMAVVNKLIYYSSPKTLGSWRSNLCFITDDIDHGWEDLFTTESEKYAGKIGQLHPELQVNKIYPDAFKQISTGNTEIYPEVNTAINRTMNEGALFVNYQGHGGEKGWAQEAILTVPMINAWRNLDNMPVLFTATCEFGRFDEPEIVSGGQLCLLNPNGGAIGLMTTTRLVFVSGNLDINNDFWTNYGFPKANEPIPTIGDLFKRMKNRTFVSSEDTKFALLGDPSMRLNFPYHNCVIDTVNGIELANFKDTFKAFSVVNIKGHIQERLAGKFSSFNGNLWVKLYDKPTTRYTLDNDGQNKKVPYSDQSSLIYKGVVSVTNGEFRIVFPIPKDIAYNIDFGKIYMYAHNGVTDASGAEYFLIGGSQNVIEPDDEGPTVRLYMNDTTFKNGGEVNPSAVFLARVFDKNGLNTTGAGIGRDMIATIDKGTASEQTVVVNEFFSYDLNSYTLGTVRFNYNDLAYGKHTITFKVWDIHNNSSEEVVHFKVVSPTAFNILSNSAYPNPFNTNSGITIKFEHNRAGQNLTAELNLTDMAGRTYVKTTHDIEQAESQEKIVLNASSSNGSEIPAGLYVYTVILTAPDGKQVRFSGKLVKI